MPLISEDMKDFELTILSTQLVRNFPESRKALTYCALKRDGTREKTKPLP
jgi:hypothetical protein